MISVLYSCPPKENPIDACVKSQYPANSPPHTAHPFRTPHRSPPHLAHAREDRVPHRIRFLASVDHDAALPRPVPLILNDQFATLGLGSRRTRRKSYRYRHRTSRAISEPTLFCSPKVIWSLPTGIARTQKLGSPPSARRKALPSGSAPHLLSGLRSHLRHKLQVARLLHRDVDHGTA